MTLEQRQIDLSGESLYNILSIIANFILTGVKEVKLSIKNPKYRIRTVNVKGNLILINYFKLYRLFIYCPLILFIYLFFFLLVKDSGII